MKGKRTMIDLARSCVPARLSVMLAVLALGAAVGVHMVAQIAGLIEPRVGAKLHQIAGTLEAMPLWVLIGGTMAQVAGRLLQAWDDAVAFLNTRRTQLEPFEPQQIDPILAADQHGVELRDCKRSRW
jgi:hypothetical protein